MQHAERIPPRAPRFAGWTSFVSGRNTDQACEAATRKGDARSHRLEVIPSLDGLRAISVLIVVLGHSGLEALVPGGRLIPLSQGRSIGSGSWRTTALWGAPRPMMSR